ncbi:EGF-containing fibulin-like extracellular matrix protein 1 [Sardina pilchardus]|uniref:EGF-containing fibulin-like extracellular matrix protein 1 n=1 Tax=Sardina pilchardus TaxID=27697 RepID=UPI002E126FFF
MLRVCLCVSLIINVALSQQDTEEPVTYTCTDGYEYDSARQVCRDIDECVTLADACKGGMKCVNHYGGYLCLPHSAQIIVSNGEEEEVADPSPPPQRPALPPVRTPHVPAAGPVSSGGDLAQGARLPVQGHTIQCSAGFVPDEHGYCRDIDECAGNPCQQQCINILGSFICKCEHGYDLAPDAVSCQDINECAFSPYMCQGDCVNQPGSYVCVCPEGYQLQAARLCQDINECDAGHNCREDQMCWNYHGGFRCYPRNPCREPYTQTGEGRCSCQAAAGACRGLPPSIVYKYMSISSERSVPADIFQIQATSVYPNMLNTFRIKAGNEGEEFYLRRTSNVSAMLVMTRALRGPREHVVDLEMITQNSALNYRSTSLLRLTIVIGAHTF